MNSEHKQNSQRPGLSGSEHHDDEGSHDEPWLVSYADLMTLLFGFFVLMYSFAAAKLENRESMVLIRKELAQFFGGNYINPLDAASKSISAATKTPEFMKEVDSRIEPGKLELTLRSTNLFEPGKNVLTGSARKLMDEIIVNLKNTPGDFNIRIEGHTDDSPTGNSWSSNWALSSARASTVLELFEKNGFAANRLTAMGHGASRPLVPNRDAEGKYIVENMARNRRVVIVVTQKLEQDQ